MDTVEELTEIMKVLSDPTRLKLLQLLTQPSGKINDDECCGGGRFYCVNACANLLGVSQSAISQHLRILRSAHLVRGVRRGRFMHYILDADGLERVRRIFSDMLTDIPTE
jgi:DNA-binding transcriptional ArsR family regulator